MSFVPMLCPVVPKTPGVIGVSEKFASDFVLVFLSQFSSNLFRLHIDGKLTLFRVS